MVWCVLNIKEYSTYTVVYRHYKFTANQTVWITAFYKMSVTERKTNKKRKEGTISLLLFRRERQKKVGFTEQNSWTVDQF